MQLTIEQARQNAINAGYSPEQVDAFIASKFSQFTPEGKNAIAQGQASKVPNDFGTTPVQTSANIEAARPTNLTDVIKKIQPIISMIAGGAAGVATENPMAGSAAMAGTDALIDKFTGQKPSYPISDLVGLDANGGNIPGASLAENTLFNEGLGRVINYPVKKLSNAITNMVKEADVSALGKGKYSFSNPIQYGTAKLRDKLIDMFGSPNTASSVGRGSVSGDISKFDPTYSQLRDASGKSKTFSEFTENMFAPAQKHEANVNTGKLVKEHADSIVQDLTGRPKVTIDSQEELANNLAVRTGTNWDNFKVTRENNANDIAHTESLIRQFPSDKVLQANLVKLKDFQKNLNLSGNNFFPMSSKGNDIGDLIADEVTHLGISRSNAPLPIVRNILYDPIKVQRFLNSGNIKIGNTVVTSTNVSKDLAGEAFADIINSARNYADDTLNVNDLQSNWNKYKLSDAGRKIFSNAQKRADMDQFISQMSHVAEKVGDKGASKYLLLRLGTATASLGGGLATSMVSGSTTKGMGVAGTIIGGAIGLNQLGKLMTNPDTARLMIAAVSGGPLNMAPAVASRVIARALRGQPISIEAQDQNGKTITIPGKLDSMGKFKADTSTDQPIGNIKVKGQ